MQRAYTIERINILVSIRGSDEFALLPGCYVSYGDNGFQMTVAIGNLFGQEVNDCLFP